MLDRILFANILNHFVKIDELTHKSAVKTVVHVKRHWVTSWGHVMGSLIDDKHPSVLAQLNLPLKVHYPFKIERGNIP